MKHRIPIIALALLMTSCLAAEPTTKPATQPVNLKGQRAATRAAEIMYLKREIVEARLEETQARAALEDLKKQIDSGKLEKHPAMRDMDYLLRGLRAHEAKLSAAHKNALQKFGSKHRQVREIEGQLNAVRGQITARKKLVLEHNTAASLQVRMMQLDAATAELLDLQNRHDKLVKPPATTKPAGDDLPDSIAVTVPPEKVTKHDAWVAVPRVVQVDLYRRMVTIAQAAFPDADFNNWKKILANELLRDHYLVRSIKGVGGPSYGSAFSMSFPSGRRLWRLSRATKGRPASVTLPERTQPLKAAEARKIALDFVGRLGRMGLIDARVPLIAKLSGSRDFHAFTFRPAGDTPVHIAGPSVVVVIGKADGLIDSVQLTSSLRAPEDVVAKIVSEAKAVIPNFDPKQFRLEEMFRSCRRKLVLKYEVVTISEPPDGVADTNVKVWGWWDAETGRLVYSGRLKGGSPDRPYMNKTFFAKAPPAEMRKNLIHLIQLRAAQLNAAAAPPKPTIKPTTQSAVQEYVRRIEAILPKGWSVEAGDGLITVRRNRKVTVSTFIPNRPVNSPDTEQTLERFSIVLKFGPPMTSKQYRRMVEENEETFRKLRAMIKKMRHITHKFHQYIASTPEDKKLVETYERLRKSFHRVPDLFSPEHSITLRVSPDSGSGFVAIADKQVQAECAAVRGKIEKLFQKTPTATQSTSRPTTTISAPAVGPKVMAILKRLEAAGEKYPNITAKIDFKVDMLQTGDTESRTGKVYYQGPSEKESAKFRIHFDTLRQGKGPKIKYVVDYAYDGEWLTERKERIKQMNRYQVALPGEKVNPLQLGKGPFPVPFGQKAQAVIKYFRPTTRPVKKAAPKNTDYIKLTTRRQYRKEFSVVWMEMWVDRISGLPVKIVTEDRSENVKTIVFKKIAMPKSFDKKIFTLPRPPAGWEYHVERFKK